jgi:hypothetical protein
MPSNPQGAEDTAEIVALELAFGTPPDQIAILTHSTIDALVRALRGAGRGDIAEQLIGAVRTIREDQCGTD